MTTLKNQKIKFTGQMTENGEKLDVIATVRHDDQCGNGHNTFAITGEVYLAGNPRTDRNLVSCGCVHEYIEKAIPELKPFIKWHLTSTDGPMPYIANTLYHAKPISKHKGQWFVYFSDPEIGVRKTLLGILSGSQLSELKDKYPNATISTEEHYESMAKDSDLNAARSSAVWPDAELSDFTKENLEARLPALMADFRKDVESLGLTY